MTEWDLTLDRLRAGTTLNEEAERLGRTYGSLYHWIWRDEDRHRDFVEAREIGAEAQNDYMIAKARELLDAAPEEEGGLTPSQIRAREVGIKALQWVLPRNNRNRFSEEVSHRHEHDVASDLKQRFFELANRANEKERAALTHDPGKIIDADFEDLSPRETVPHAGDEGKGQDGEID